MLECFLDTFRWGFFSKCSFEKIPWFFREDGSKLHIYFSNGWFKYHLLVVFLDRFPTANCWQILTPALPQRPRSSHRKLQFRQFRFPWWGFFVRQFLAYFCEILILLSQLSEEDWDQKSFQCQFQNLSSCRRLDQKIQKQKHHVWNFLCYFPASNYLKPEENKNQPSFPIWFHRSDGESRTFEAFARTRGWMKTFPGAPNYELCECTKDYITCIFYRGIHHWVI